MDEDREKSAEPLDYACSFYVGRVPEAIFSTDDSITLKVLSALV